MKNRIAISITVLLLLVQASAFGASPESVQEKITSAIRTEASAQEKADDWSAEKEELLNEIRELKTRITWVKYQQDKHRLYIKEVRDNIAGLERKKLEARKVREQLEPYLEEVVARFEAFVATDLPFLNEEREQRIKFLKMTMNDYHLNLGEKLRRVIEALSVEAAYGKIVMATEETLTVNGQEIQVSVLRLGRLGMFYQSLDGKNYGLYNLSSRKWEPLSKDFNRDIRYGLEMARRERSVQLIELPLGAIKK